MIRNILSIVKHLIPSDISKKYSGCDRPPLLFKYAPIPTMPARRQASMRSSTTNASINGPSAVTDDGDKAGNSGGGRAQHRYQNGNFASASASTSAAAGKAGVGRAAGVQVAFSGSAHATTSDRAKRKQMIMSRGNNVRVSGGATTFPLRGMIDGISMQPVNVGGNELSCSDGTAYNASNLQPVKRQKRCNDDGSASAEMVYTKMVKSRTLQLADKNSGTMASEAWNREWQDPLAIRMQKTQHQAAWNAFLTQHCHWKGW